MTQNEYDKYAQMEREKYREQFKDSRYYKDSGRNNKLSSCFPVIVSAALFILLLVGFGTYIFMNKADLTRTEKTDSEKAEKKQARLSVIFVDQPFSIAGPNAVKPELSGEGEIPVGYHVTTNRDSQRNIFSTSPPHTIRFSEDSYFTVDSNTPEADFKLRVKISLDRGRAWIDANGDLFEIKTPKGTIIGNGGAFEVSVSEDGGVRTTAWGDDLTFIPADTLKEKRNITKGNLLFVDSGGNFIPAEMEDSKDDWQKWNLAVSSADALQKRLITVAGASGISPDEKTVKKVVKQEPPPDKISTGSRQDSGSKGKAAATKAFDGTVHSEPAPKKTLEPPAFDEPDKIPTHATSTGNSGSKTLPGNLTPEVPAYKQPGASHNPEDGEADVFDGTLHHELPGSRETTGEDSGKSSPLDNPEVVTGNPLENKPATEKPPGYGTGDKPLGPSGPSYDPYSY